MAKKKKYKTPPARLPASVQDVHAAYNKGIDLGVRNAYAIMFISLRDHYGFDNDMLLDLHKHLEDYADEVGKDPKLLQDIIRVLHDEYQIDM